MKPVLVFFTLFESIKIMCLPANSGCSENASVVLGTNKLCFSFDTFRGLFLFKKVYSVQFAHFMVLYLTIYIFFHKGNCYCYQMRGYISSIVPKRLTTGLSSHQNGRRGDGSIGQHILDRSLSPICCTVLFNINKDNQNYGV